MTVMPFTNRSRAKLRGVLLDQPLNGDECCQACGGACCRSFSDVALTWDEYKRLQELGATRLQLSLTGPHRLVIDYNCEFLVNGRCSIYEDRPEICRRFSCINVT
jgi:Fe-S-cluster containining protein